MGFEFVTNDNHFPGCLWKLHLVDAFIPVWSLADGHWLMMALKRGGKWLHGLWRFKMMQITIKSEKNFSFFFFYNNKPSEVWSDEGCNNKTIWGFSGAFSTMKRSLSDRGITKVNSVRSSPLAAQNTFYYLKNLVYCNPSIISESYPRISLFVLPISCDLSTPRSPYNGPKPGYKQINMEG